MPCLTPFFAKFIIADEQTILWTQHQVQLWPISTPNFSCVNYNVSLVIAIKPKVKKSSHSPHLVILSSTKTLLSKKTHAFQYHWTLSIKTVQLTWHCSYSMYKSNNYYSNTNLRTTVFWCSFITKYPPTSLGHLCGSHQGRINKNTLTNAEVSEPLHY